MIEQVPAVSRTAAYEVKMPSQMDHHAAERYNGWLSYRCLAGETLVHRASDHPPMAQAWQGILKRSFIMLEVDSSPPSMLIPPTGVRSI